MILCMNAAQSSFCTDPGKDPANCGGCGRVCPANTFCNAGTCQPGGGTTTPGGMAACPGTNGAPVCTNIYNDSANCGGCGHICTDGTYCMGGVCAQPPTCPAGNALCGDPASGKRYCTDVSVDSGNCGACGIFCQGGTYCMGGICVVGMQPTCPAPGMNCVDQPTGKMYCARVDSDPGNCGRCGNVCPAGTYCQNYGCVPMAGSDGGTTGCADPMSVRGWRARQLRCVRQRLLGGIGLPEL